MPHHKSTAKRLRQNARERAYNRAVRTRVRNAVKVARQDENGDAGARVILAHSELDRAVRKGVVPRRRADRLKSRLARNASK